MIYLLIFLLLVYGCFQYDYKQVDPNTQPYKRLEWMAFILLVLVPGLSYRIGVDTPSYMMHYEYAPTLGQLTLNYLNTEGHEPIWLIFQSACKTISSEYAFMHTIHSLFLHTALFYMIHQFTKKHFAVLLFYFVVSWGHCNFEALRESIAVAFYFVAITQMIKRDSLKAFLLWSIPALFAHNFSFVVVAVTAAVYLYRRNRVLSIGIIAATTGMIIYRLDDLILMMADNENVQSKMLYYMESNTEGDTVLNIIGTLSYIVQLVIPPVALLFLDAKAKVIPSNYKLILVTAIIFGAIASFFSDFRRLYYYVFPFVMICFTLYFGHHSDVIKYGLNKMVHRGLMVVMVFIIYQSVVSFYRPSVVETRSNIKYNAFYFPYHSVFTEEKDADREYLMRY